MKFSIQKFKEMGTKFKNLTIRKKLYNSFILLSFISILSGLIRLIFIQKTTTDYNYALINFGYKNSR